LGNPVINGQLCRWHPAPNAQAFQNFALKTVLDAAQQAILERGAFRLVLAGGKTPGLIYQALRYEPIDWAAWHLYHADERCLPIGDSERNATLARSLWLDHVPVPTQQIHDIPGELGATEGALRYAQTLNDVGLFDLVLLGLGEDGHTASLFPDHTWGTTADSPDTLAILDSPKPPPERISLSAARLSRTRQALFLVSGAGKHLAVTRWRSGDAIPAQSIQPASGVDILLDGALYDTRDTHSLN